jgi:hypothetical protein
MNEIPPLNQNSDKEKMPPSVAKMVFSKLSELSDKHGPQIKTWVTVVQSITAILMLVTLILGWQALTLSQRQFESTIEPVLEISYQTPQILETNLVPGSTTNYYLGVPIENVYTNFNFTFTNTAIATFKNIGCVSISHLELFMWMDIAFDEHQKATNFLYSRTSNLFSEILSPNQSVTYDFGNEPVLQNLVKMNRQERKGRALYFVMRYQRSVDMKPKYKLVMFEIVSSNPNGERPYAMAFDNNRLYIGHSDKNGVLESQAMKTEAKKFWSVSIFTSLMSDEENPSPTSRPSRDKFVQGANNSPSVSSTASAVAASSLPSRLTRRDLSTARIWSRAISPVLF